MKKRAIVFAMLILSGCTTASQELVGNSYNFTTPNGSGKIEYRENGVVVARTGRGTLRGKWEIQGGKMCTSFPQLRGGKFACFDYKADGDGYADADEGVTLRPI